MSTILIVDDSPTEVQALTHLLERTGYRIVSASDGEDGVAIARSERPDLILMDVVMPGLNGFQATRQLSKDPQTASIPVIMVTKKDQETDRHWGMRQGAKDYIVKPFDQSELLDKIAAIVAPGA